MVTSDVGMSLNQFRRKIMLDEYERVIEVKFEFANDEIHFSTDAFFQEGKIRKYIIRKGDLPQKFRHHPLLLLNELCQVNCRKREILKVFLEQPRRAVSIEIPSLLVRPRIIRI